MTTATILIADDHPIFRLGLRQAIEDLPGTWNVHEAEDGEKAIQICQSQELDLAILDVKMPKTDGLSAAQRLRQEHPTLKVMLFTMYDDQDLLDEALKAGVLGYVLKDDPITEVLRAIHLVLEGKHYLSSVLFDRYVARKQGPRDPDKTPQPNLDTLTVTERKLLRLIADDLTSKEIADQLGCSVHTINAHRQNMSTKLGLHGTHSLLKFAYAHRHDAYPASQPPETRTGPVTS